MEQVDLINKLFGQIAESRIQFFVVCSLNQDGSFEISYSGNASYLEKIGLMEQAKMDIINSVYNEEEGVS